MHGAAEGAVRDRQAAQAARLEALGKLTTELKVRVRVRVRIRVS